MEQNSNGAPDNKAPTNSLGKVADTLNKAALLLTEEIDKTAAVSPNSLVAAEKDKPQIILDTNGQLELVQEQSSVKQEVQAITEEQRKKAQQYALDKAFYEKQILQKSRSAAAINDDYIKILHPTYRHKFVDAYGVTVRADVLRRMRAIIPAFNAEIEDALAMYQGSLQIAMHQRAVEGVEKIIRDREGKEIDRERVYSDSLLAKMVDTHTPEYKEAKQKETNKGNTINVQIIKDFHNYKSTRDN